MGIIANRGVLLDVATDFLDVMRQVRDRRQAAGHPTGLEHVTEDELADVMATRPVTVNNVTPQALVELTLPTDDPVLCANFQLLDPSSDSLVLTVDYGDGSSTQTHTVGRRRSFVLKHRFAQTGTFNLTFTLRDGDGGVTTLQRQVAI